MPNYTAPPTPPHTHTHRACNLCFISLLLMLYLINAFSESIIHPLIDKQYIPSAHTHQARQSVINSICKFPRAPTPMVTGCNDSSSCEVMESWDPITSDCNGKTKAFVWRTYPFGPMGWPKRRDFWSPRVSWSAVDQQEPQQQHLNASYFVSGQN